MASACSTPLSLLHKPHVVAVPLPLYSHMTPLLNMCCVIASHGITVTFAVVENKRGMVQQLLQQEQVDRAIVSNIRVVAISDGLPSDFDYCVGQSDRLCRSIPEIVSSFGSLMEKLVLQSPPVSCLLSDTLFGWTQDVADAFCIPRIALWISSAAECSIFLSIPELVSNGLFPFAENENQEEVPISIPGHLPLHRRDFPSDLQVSCTSTGPFRFLVGNTDLLRKAAMIIVNTSYELETSVLDIWGTAVPLLPMGPLLLLGNEKTIKVGLHLQAEEDLCLQWLDGQAPSSVLYLAFGSGACAEMTIAQVEELARGLEASRVPFLWAFRPDLIKETDATAFVESLRNRIGEQGLLVSWSPQQRVLTHPSVGSFLTHCGWNSTLEGICAAKPMLCWPFGTDQFLHCKLIVEQWRIGLKLEKRPDGCVDKQEVTNKLHRLMSSGEGTEMRSRISSVGKAVLSGVMEGGMSVINIQRLVDKIRSC